MTATITYTSARRHKPDVVGAELAPSMVYTNWTVVSNAQLGNDADGNLTVTYNAVSVPRASKLFTVTSGAIYRIIVNTVADGSSQYPAVLVGTSLGGAELANWDGRAALSITTDERVVLYVRAASTSLYVSLACWTSSAGYAAFSDVSVRQVTTLGHSSAIAVLSDDILSSTGSYTASSSTIAAADIYNYNAYNYNGIYLLPRNDNAIRVTNSGAANGQARRTNSSPSIAGRTYKASTLWIPHECASATIAAGSTAGGTDFGTATLYADIDNAAPFFTTGTDDGGTALRWDFTSTDDSWVSTYITPTNNATYIALASTTTAPTFTRAGLSFSGYENRYVICSVRRTSASFTQNAFLYYKTADHGFSASYYASRGAATLAQVTAGSGAYTVIVWDMWLLAAGGTDWKDNTITDLRIDFTSTSGATWEVNHIAVGNLNPLELEFAPTGQDYSYLTLQNSNESGAVSYYVLPNVTQLDSDYTLTPAISAADQEYPEDIRQSISLDGTTETTFYREDENWTITTTVIDGNDALADYIEFLSSCKAGETFTIDLYGDGDEKTAMLRQGASSIQRVEGDKFRVTIAYRVIA